MSTLELKQAIFDKLKSVDDDVLLQKIMSLLNLDNDKIYHLNEFELRMIKEGEEDIKFGRLYTNEEVIAEEKKWLNE